ncbi:hypothetical protein KY495_16660 [Massilia sp. PAMC28688]|uniref:hypothetical protein n=1 Tax=Massilia sp. PAMC28688 TaxID=2861283 RepID=UPI001C62E3F0|nr:hypothetical protein [Massilia sp. PAMC28688]QYF92375.1 hypothetical protein KY495_16660 [Massilia sp. PAMC28688]
MRKVLLTTMVAAGLALSGCAGMLREAPVPGDTVELIRAKFGQPTAVYQSARGRVLEYATSPFGQFTWMARLGPDGRLALFEQVLTGEKFATLQIGVARRDDVLHAIGRPAERSWLRLPDLEVWSYRYKESGVWNSMMHLHFDRGGTLRMMQNGPDPMFEEKRFFRD